MIAAYNFNRGSSRDRGLFKLSGKASTQTNIHKVAISSFSWKFERLQVPENSGSSLQPRKNSKMQVRSIKENSSICL